MASRLDRIAANVTSILSTVRRYQAMAKVHEAASNVQATLGQEPNFGSLDDLGLPILTELVYEDLTKNLHFAKPETPSVPPVLSPQPVVLPKEPAPEPTKPQAVDPKPVHAEPIHTGAMSTGAPLPMVKQSHSPARNPSVVLAKSTT